MLTISKPPSSTQAQTYHAKEFTAAEQNYWKQEDTIQGEWRGKLAEEVWALWRDRRVGVFPFRRGAAPVDGRTARSSPRRP
jgi:hypothetical protein